MALNDPNVQAIYPNVCIGPQLGTYATMTWNDLVIKNNTGATVATYALSTNLTVDVSSLEYVNARDQNSAFDGATFFSLQHYSSTRAVIKRWEININSQSLDLKNTIIKDSGSTYKYDSQAFAIEYHHRTFASDESNDDRIIINSLSRISSGDRMLLGPSSDTDNPGEVEWMVVDSTYTDGGGNKWVVFTSDFNYDYVNGDPISFYKYIYIFTNDHTTDGRGAVYRLHPETGAESESNQGVVFQDVTAAAWNEFYTMPTFARYNQLFHLNHLLGYVVYRAHTCWLNIEDDHITVVPIYDLVFDDNEIGKLQRKITLQDNSGNLATTSWSNYNFHYDTALQYSSVLSIWGDPDTEVERRLLKSNETVALEARLESQYGFPLNSVNVTFTSDDSPPGTFTPVDGIVTTDNDGYARITYNVGLAPAATIHISATAPGAPGFFGNDNNKVFAELELFTIQDIENETHLIKQVAPSYAAQAHMIKQKTATFSHNNTSDFGHIRQLTIVRNPRTGSNKKTVRQLQNFQSSRPIQTWFASGDGFSLGYPLVYPRTEGDTELDPPFLRFRQIEDLNSTVRTSQLYQAHHKATELSTTEGINQFFFVIEAIPPWYSIKNPIVQTIYLRILPFAFDLDQSTFHILVKNTWTREGVDYSTGWIDVTTASTINPFVGPPTGLTILYDPDPGTWEYDSRVWVRFYVYDTDPSGANLMDVTYWFDIIPDYRGPEIINHDPERFASNVDVDTNISFDVIDYGIGVDPDVLEVSLDGILVEPWNATTISGGYRFEYNPPSDFYYDQEISVTIDAYDLNGNITHQTYYFNTGESSGPWYHGAYPLKCAEGVIHDSKVELQLYAIDHGINTTTILVKVDRENREFIMYPIVYRLS